MPEETRDPCVRCLQALREAFMAVCGVRWDVMTRDWRGASRAIPEAESAMAKVEEECMRGLPGFLDSPKAFREKLARAREAVSRAKEYVEAGSAELSIYATEDALRNLADLMDMAVKRCKVCL